MWKSVDYYIFLTPGSFAFLILLVKHLIDFAHNFQVVLLKITWGSELHWSEDVYSKLSCVWLCFAEYGKSATQMRYRIASHELQKVLCVIKKLFFPTAPKISLFLYRFLFLSTLWKSIVKEGNPLSCEKIKILNYTVSAVDSNYYFFMQPLVLRIKFYSLSSTKKTCM